MSKFDLTMLPPWEQLFKRVLWAQLGDLRGKRILDFGSGIGVTACHYAAENEVIAVEPTADWLCSDEAELDKYLADPLVRKDISAGLFRELLGSMKRTGNVDSYRRWNKEMPVYLMYGTKDAVGDFGKGVRQVYNQMKKAGLCDIEFEQYTDGRHDILHEERSCAEIVRHSIADWLDQLCCDFWFDRVQRE